MVREDAGTQLAAVHLVWGETRLLCGGGGGDGGTVGRVITGPTITVHLLTPVTVTVERGEPLACRAGLVAHTALVTEVVVVAGVSVLQLYEVSGSAHPAVRERVVTLPASENILSGKIFEDRHETLEIFILHTLQQRRGRPGRGE